MRITNVRRGRIIRVAGICMILLLLIYALHSYSNNSNFNVENISNDIIPDSQKSYYKFHRDVYPVLETESKLMDTNPPITPSISFWSSTTGHRPTRSKSTSSSAETSDFNGLSISSIESVTGKSVFFLQKLGNFEPIVKKVVKGPGEEGKPYHMASDRVNDIADSESEYGMNIAASDDIAMNRSIPDTRNDECKYWHYPQDLPSTSVIIVFHNEGFSVLMRTVHSVIDRSPPNILHEIVLVDDYSDKENLKQNLDIYIRRWNGKVRLIRNAQREGLIRTRSRGAQEATGDVIVFLDAHCEVNTNWLPPLLAPIYRDYRIMTVPVIDGVDHKTFEYRPVYQRDSNYRGIFEWGMLYKENEVPDREASLHKHLSEPYKSPTHAGGLFAINRQYFLEIGAYDPGLLVWGGENFELSFKIWQCGGSIEWVPCSRVGHVYRAFMPYSFGSLAKNRKGSLITINYKRVIETWFDEEHKEYFYTREPMARFLDMGDISEQIALKEKLKCKSFSWFMENVAYDVYDKFPKLPKNVHWGMVKNKATGLCLDTMGKPAPAYIGTSGCHGAGNNQLFRLNEAGQLGVGERCVEGDTDSIKQAICRLGTVDGPWRYDDEHSHLVHRLHSHCLTLQPHARTLGLAPCDPHNTYQQWTITHKKPNW